MYWFDLRQSFYLHHPIKNTSSSGKHLPGQSYNYPEGTIFVYMYFCFNRKKKKIHEPYPYGSNYPYLKQTSMVLKMFKPLKSDSTWFLASIQQQFLTQLSL